ncbi:acyltransferase [Thalassotalea agariperforans]
MKTLIKEVIFLLFALIVLPLTLIYLVLNLILKSDSLFAAFSQFLSLLPGKTGSLLRTGFYRFTMKYCHPNVVIGFGTLFSQRSTAILKNTYIGPQCNIGKCQIGKDTLLGSGVHIMSGKGQHNFDDLSTPIKDQGGSFEQITIGDDCWLGNGALIMANIGNHCVVAAGSVVINDIPDYAIVAGNPAKVIKMRNA